MMRSLAAATLIPGVVGDGVKYEVVGKCLAVGEPLEGHNRNEQYHLTVVDCDAANEWTESLGPQTDSQPRNFQISTPLKDIKGGEACLSFLGDATCEEGSEVVVGKCPRAVKGETFNTRLFWSTDAKKIVSDLCYREKCVDLVDGTAVLKTCKHSAQWTRHGSSTPPPLPVLHPAGHAAAKIGGYELKWPLSTEYAGIGASGYPEYWGNNNAEACPADKRTDCRGGCKCLWANKHDLPNPFTHAQGGLHGAPPMTRSDINQRAIVWIANGFDQNHDDRDKTSAHGMEGCAAGDSPESCPRYWHGGACCSLPSMAWNITGCIKSTGLAQRIDCKDLRPGDGLNMHGKHVALFARWTNDQKTHMKMYEFKGKARMSDKALESGMICYKRKNIIEDVEPDNVPLGIEFDDGEDLMDESAVMV